MGLRVIGYGFVQGSAPALRRSWISTSPPGPSAVQFWSAVLTAIPAQMPITLWRQVGQPGFTAVVGLAAFGVGFTMNSSIHSYMVLSYTDSDSVSLNVGFYYMANGGWSALCSPEPVPVGGLQACLWCSALLVALAWLMGTRLPIPPRQSPI